jgi:gamma-glutamyltranspeptidase/glutathione hydrolase
MSPARGLLFALIFPAVAQHTMFPPVLGTREMVGAANNLEVEAGFRMLEQGGNAVDAGVAATLAAAVTEQSRFGLGGEMPLLVKMAGKPVVAISGIGVAPAKATVEFYSHRAAEPWEPAGRLPPIPAQGIRSAITPGVLDGLLLALEKYGTMSFTQVVQPAIECADGFPIEDEFAELLGTFVSTIRDWPDAYKFFYPTGKPPLRHELVRMPALARTLRELASAESKTKGDRTAKIQAVRDLFYRGSIAKRIAAFSEANGGLIAYEDLARFGADLNEPKSTTYRGYTIYKPGFWTQGPVMLEMLNLLEGVDLKRMGHNSPEYLHTLVEAMKLAFADRERFYGDPKFSTIPEETLLSKSYAAERRKLIDPAHASMQSRPGDLHESAPMTSGNGKSSNSDTTCVNVIDRNGNAFSATPSGAWLPSVIAGDTGIPLSTRLQSFVVTPGHANQLAPGKRPRVTLSPTVVSKDGQLDFIMSTPGGDNQDQALLQVFLNMVEFGMNPQEAVESPRFQSDHFYNSFAYHEFTPGVLSLEGRMPRSVGEKLGALGHRVQVAGDWSNGSAPTVIQVRDKVLEGGADPRRARFIFGR